MDCRCRWRRVGWRDWFRRRARGLLAGPRRSRFLGGPFSHGFWAARSVTCSGRPVRSRLLGGPFDHASWAACSVTCSGRPIRSHVLGGSFGHMFWAAHSVTSPGRPIRSRLLGGPFGRVSWAAQSVPSSGGPARSRFLGGPVGRVSWAARSVALPGRAEPIHPGWAQPGRIRTSPTPSGVESAPLVALALVLHGTTPRIARSASEEPPAEQVRPGWASDDSGFRPAGPPRAVESAPRRPPVGSNLRRGSLSPSCSTVQRRGSLVPRQEDLPLSRSDPAGPPTTADSGRLGPPGRSNPHLADPQWGRVCGSGPGRVQAHCETPRIGGP